MFASAIGLWLDNFEGSPFLYKSMVRLIFHDVGICFCLEQWEKNRESSLWKQSGMFFRIILGILSGPGVLLFARFLRQVSYVSLSKYSCNGVCGFPLLSMT